MNLRQSPFESYWMAGFEGADHINGSGMPLDPNQANGHWKKLDEDYAALAALGVHTIRESIGWRLYEDDADFGAERLHLQAMLARKHGLQVIWTLLHYGWPQRLNPRERPSEFVEAFAAHCERIALQLHGRTSADARLPPPVYQPVNEISFLSWAASQTGLISPFVPTGTAADVAAGNTLKRLFVQCAIAACDAIWSVDARARIVHTDPLIHIGPQFPCDVASVAMARQAHESQFEAWDMLAGTRAPELGGDAKYLDIVGLNYYHSNQWEFESNRRFDWHLQDPRRVDFRDLVREVWSRYGRPLLISETGHIGEGRADWLDDIARSATSCADAGMPLLGVCLYPIVDRPDWEDPAHWHHCGLWDVPGAMLGDFKRQVHQPFLDRLRHWTLLGTAAHKAQAAHVSPQPSIGAN